MTKQEVIDRISQLNRSARAEFLAEFSEAELQQYLRNLEEVWTDFRAQFVDSDRFDQEHQPTSVQEPAPLLVG